MTRVILLLLTVLFSLSGPAIGGQCEFEWSSLAAKTTEYGPFHRVSSPSQTAETAAKIETSGELWGQGARQSGGGRGIPAAKAYDGPLPEGASGVQFTTPVKPTPGSPPGQVRWVKGHDGVLDIDDDWVKVPVDVSKNTQR